MIFQIFLKKEFYPLPKPIEDAYNQSQVTVFEVDFQEMKSPEAQLKMVQQGKYPEGQTIRQHVSKETYDKLHAYVAERMGNGAAFDSLKPWMVAVALLGMEQVGAGIDAAAALEGEVEDPVVESMGTQGGRMGFRAIMADPGHQAGSEFRGFRPH